MQTRTRLCSTQFCYPTRETCSQQWRKKGASYLHYGLAKNTLPRPRQEHAQLSCTVNHANPVTTSTETVTSPTGQYIPGRFLLRREIVLASTYYTLTEPRKSYLCQHGRFEFCGVGVSPSIRIIKVLGKKGSQYTILFLPKPSHVALMQNRNIWPYGEQGTTWKFYLPFTAMQRNAPNEAVSVLVNRTIVSRVFDA